MIELQVSPQELTMTELVQETRREIALFQHRQRTTDGHGYELFRRAITMHDEWAWVCIYDLYRPLVCSWILSLARKPVGEDLEALVNEVFRRFARAMTPQKWSEFVGVSPLLGYLKRCAQSAVLDACRQQQAEPHEESLDSIGEPVSDDCAEVVCERLAAQEIWRLVSCAVPTREEKLILLLVCAQGMSPRTLQQRYPTTFRDVQDIYRIRRNLIERLQRNKRLRSLLQRSREVLP